ncbi:MAG: 3'-5' exonuclease, partial [Bacteroidota bacterium]|nr:3'-5' exonuclease [Bacteroidota bacterium]
MNLLLQRPVAVIDLETTGINLVTDRVVEVAIIKVFPNGTRAVKRKLINPQMLIPQNVIDIHGITDLMVKDAPVFKQVANEIKQFLDNCDFAGYNSNRFDIPMLIEEFLRCDLNFNMEGRRLIDVQKIFHQMEQRTLSAAYKFYCEKELVGAHGAEADAVATFEILEAQVQRYPNLGNTAESICKICGEEDTIDFSRRLINVSGVA